MDPGVTLGLLVATFPASFVEFVEALTIVLAMGATRSWRSALSGVVAAVVALAGFTAAAGYALTTWLPEALLQLVVGSLLLVADAPLLVVVRGVVHGGVAGGGRGGLHRDHLRAARRQRADRRDRH